MKQLQDEDARLKELVGRAYDESDCLFGTARNKISASHCYSKNKIVNSAEELQGVRLGSKVVGPR